MHDVTRGSARERGARERLSPTWTSLLHGIAAAALAWPIAKMSAVIAAGLGATIGATLGPALVRRGIRLPVLVVSCIVGCFLSKVSADFVAQNEWFSSTMGPDAALWFSGVWFWCFLGVFISGALRALSTAQRPWVLLEVVGAAIACAQLVVAHRNGAINRPFEIADVIISQGGDPDVIFLGVGALATGIVVLLLLRERHMLRRIAHLAVVVLILFLVVRTTSVLGLPSPPAAGGLGLTKDEKQNGNSSKTPAQGQGSKPKDDLDFKDNYGSSAQQVPVGVVLFHDDYSPPTGIYYFRQSAFSQFNGKRLVATTRSDVDRDIVANFPSAPMQVPWVPEANMHRSSVETTVALLADHNRPFALEWPVELAPASNPNLARFKRVYKVTSLVLTSDHASLVGSSLGSKTWNADQWDYYRSGPQDPRYRELTEKLLNEELPAELRTDPLAQVVAITTWLSKVGTYSLRSKHAGAADPTADFLFGDRTGYCVHFAHAATFMMRSVGLPARVATGYALQESSRQGGSALLISDRDAHAWPEVFFQESGWVIADVTPQRVLDPPPKPPDPDLQRLLGELARGENPLPTDQPPTIPTIMAAARKAGVTMQRVLLWASVCLLLGLFAIKWWRQLIPMFARDRTLARVLYRAVLDQMSEVDWIRERGESREAFALKLANACPTFKNLTALHVGAAFGSTRSLNSEELRGLGRSVKKELRQTVPMWRRLLGIVSPWGWLRTR